MGAGGTTVTVAAGTARRPPATSTRGSGGAYAPAPKHELASFDLLNTWYYSDAPRTLQPQLELARRESTFDEVVSAVSTSPTRCTKRGAALLRELLLLRQLLRRLPRQRRHQARRSRERYAIDYDFCKGCGLCVAECPSRHRDGAGDDLIEEVADA